MDRRRFLTVAALTVAGGLVSRPAASADEPAPLALVYRGPSVTTRGAPEAVERVLRESPLGFRTAFVGPRERDDLSESVLAGAAVYAQPGGPTVDEAWPVLASQAGAVRGFVESGGTYLGFCLGAYLAGGRPGFGLLDGAPRRYAGSDGATVDDASETTVPVDWRGTRRRLYFQDGAAFDLNGPTQILARYTNGLPAAVVHGRGTGRVGLVGAHPEADGTWLSGLGDNRDLAQDLVSSTYRARA